MMRKLLYSFLLFIFFYTAGFGQSIWTGASNSDWNLGSNWSTGVVPIASTAVEIPSTAPFPVVNAAATCLSITFTGSTGGLTVNSGITLITGVVTINSSNSSDRAINITGAGNLSASSVVVGITSTVPGNTRTTTLVSTITNFNISGNITLNSRRNNSNYNDAVFLLESGVLDLQGQVITVNQNANNNPIFSMISGAQGGTLLLANNSPFSLSGTGTNTIRLNGSNSTVNYDRAGDQNVYRTAYTNLTLSGSGTKTFAASTAVSSLLAITQGVVAALPNNIEHTAGILTLGGAGPLTSTWGSTASNPVAANTTNAFFSGNGRIRVSGAPYPAIDNNFASFGTTGQVTGTGGERDGAVTLTAPAGSVFINVKFASYGLPGGTTPNFTIGSCHAFNSRTVTTGLLGNNTARIPASGAFNDTFGDPCFGIEKNYYVVATYATPVCSGSDPFTITGSTPTGGNGTYSYFWEASTNATTGYGAAPGVNTGKDYTIQGTITQKTYYRRTVTSGIYSDPTIVIVPINTAGEITAPTRANASSTSICAGTAITLSITGGNIGSNTGGYAEWTSGTCDGVLVGRSTLTNGSLTVTPTANTTYYVKFKNACGETVCGAPVSITNPTTIALTPTTATRTTCSGTSIGNLSLAYTSTGGAPTTYSIVWNPAAVSAGFLNKTDIANTFTASNGSGTINNAVNVPANVAAGTYTGTLTVKSGSCVSFGSTVTLTVNPKPTAVVSGSAAICSGASTEVSVAFTGTAPWNISYTYGAISGTFSTSANPYTVNVNPTSTTTYAITGLSDANCTAVAGDITGNAVITVNRAPSITTHPSASAICPGSNTTFGVTAAGAGLTYQWRVSTNGGSSFSNLTNGGVYSNVTTATMNITGATAGMNNYQYRVVVSGTCSPAVTSNTANLTLNAAPSIATQPSSSAICSGNNTTFSVAATGTGLTYQWYINTNGGNTFSSISNGGVYSNVTTATMSITGATAAMNNYRYLVAVSGACGSMYVSNVAALTVNPLPTAPTVTKNSDATCESLGRVTLTGLPSGSWTINQTGFASQTLTGTTSSRIISGLAAGTYYFTVTNASNCTSSPVVPITIVNQTSTTIWNGSAWSNGDPDSSKTVIINSAANQPFTASIAACSLTINVPTGASDPNVIVPDGVTLTITNSVTSNGKLIFESGSSLVQTTNAVNTGDIIYKRTTAARRYDFTYWSMPVTKPGFSMYNLSPGTLNDKFQYYDPDAGWSVDFNGTMPMETGKGYNIRAPQSFDLTTPQNFTAVFTGVPNNGDYPVPVASGKWNLIGNPYPSAIDADELMLDNLTLGSLYFWGHEALPVLNPADGKYYYNGDFTVYNSSGATVGGSGLPFQGYIAAAQGFIARPASGTVIFNNDIRLPGSNSQFYKTAKSAGIEKNRVWLNFANTDGVFKQILVGYIQGATNTIDVNYDAVSMGANTFVDFYSINSNKKLTIQGRSLPFEKSDEVPLGYKLSAKGAYTISIDHADGIFDNQDVYLEDKETGKTTNLRLEDYKFTTAEGSFNSRFVIRYTSKTLGTDDFENLQNSVIVSVKDGVVKITSSKEALKEVNIYNVGAQLLYTKTKVNSSELVISNLHSSDQALLVKITLENGHTFTKKIIYSNL